MLIDIGGTKTLECNEHSAVEFVYLVAQRPFGEVLAAGIELLLA